ncbi:hypothetical protein HAP41_0000045305 [Bradyrhizobium barranii subsp. apii]|uniref:Uncharacterized protein n=1 Tax=Bradyrhizobium barranii subsp. apii TaxID=2819348 RepID=A0A8T5V9W5_9BRAD|nr:hypothetical protein [Bradyrhizobium barranii]UPT87272.1 hypothetical protein HAP41_0000045305 [Bradyrhizobium barranii subsp. apii]
MNPKTVIELLVRSHELARRFALLALDAAHAATPIADDIGGIANISVGALGQIDVWVDSTDADSSQSVRDALQANSVAFRNIDADDGSTSLVGRINGTDWLRIHVDDQNGLHLQVETGAVFRF